MAKKKKRSTTRRQRRSASKSTKRTSSRTSSSRRRSARPTARGSLLRNFQLSRDRKLDLLGLFLIGLSLFTTVGLFSSSRGIITAAWLDLLRWTFGWGMYVAVLALAACGAWLLARTFGAQPPRVESERVLGVVFLFLAILTILHSLLSVKDLSQGMVEARAGRGGGAVGAAVLALLLSALGAAGTVVALAAWLLIGVIFTAGLSLPELFSLLVQALDLLAQGLSNLRRRALAGRNPTPQQGVNLIPSRPVSSLEATKGPVTRAPEFSETLPTAAQVWTLPEMQVILDPGAEGKADDAFDRERARLIEETLLAFGAPAKVVEINRGPTITQFGVEPDFTEGRAGRRTKVKVSKISALADDMALALAASSIRVEAPVPGKGYVGIEVPNTEVSLVALRDVMEAESFQRIPSRLRLGLGKDVSGRAVAADLISMPHLLIAGTTGSGKSVCVNAIITSLLLQNTPEELRFLMVDPKRVELTYYNGVPHLLAPVVVELDRVVPALQWVSREMDARYQRFSREGSRNISDYNQRMQLMQRTPLPYLVVVIDELADLMIMAPDETERVITRLAQLARATGIHLVIATQRPSVDVVTGLIKANFPARIAFAVASSVDSRVILDQPGAERLLGRGDMLFQAPDASAPLRMQGAFVSENELARLIRFWKNAAMGGEMTRPSDAIPSETIPPGAPLKQAALWEDQPPVDDEVDPIFDEAVQVLRQMHRASISLLQRRLRIGYTRAARLVDQLEERGIIGPAKSGSQAREVLDYGETAAEE